jgi:SAM-dependent methyltransferase
MRFFPHDELRYYFFGLRAGLANAAVNRLRLGAKKTLGKIAQPINAPSRFPEYSCFETAIREHASRQTTPHPLRILDVGSPKLMGLYLAHTTSATVLLTDITALNVDEYRVMWSALGRRAAGRALFALEDARSLPFRAGEFDVVYAMSVIEHIEGDAGDRQAIRELIRVLKPGGLLLVSVPFGRQYVEQHRLGFAGAARRTGDQQAYFFQRIYDRQAFETRILDEARIGADVRVTTIARVRPQLARAFGRLGENARGLLGFLNPVLSSAVNQRRRGIDDDFDVSYGRLHTAGDVYGDLILVGWKRL